MRYPKSNLKIMCVVGTRPEFIRMAPVIKAVKDDPRAKLILVHTGQHYSYLMDKIFFDQLQIPKPNFCLNIGSGLTGEQTSKVITRMEKAILRYQPDLVIVFGDTNSSLGAALAAAKLNFPLAHIEAGCRNNDPKMPEEINRRLIDHCSDYL